MEAEYRNRSDQTGPIAISDIPVYRGTIARLLKLFKPKDAERSEKLVQLGESIRNDSLPEVRSAFEPGNEDLF